MAVLKWIISVLLAIIGLCGVIGVGALLFFIGSVIGTIAIGAFVVLLIAVGIRELFDR